MMTSRIRRRAPGQRMIGLGVVVALHAGAITALVNGMGIRVTDVLTAPLEVKLVAEVKPPEPPKLDPPPPKPKEVVKPKPATVPPPVVRREAPPPPTAITAVTQAEPPPPAPVVVAPEPVREARVAPTLDPGRRCPQPQYPPAARHAGEAGAVVLRFLIETDGSVAESLIDSSSGFERLDEAARKALAACQFKPGSVNGVSERSWARIRYVWKLQ